jgi:GNAT superfamily N-acetyltransferase
MEITVQEYKNSEKAALIELVGSLQKHTAESDPLRRFIFSPDYAEVYAEKLLQAVSEREGKIYFAEEGQDLLGFIAGTIQAEPPGGTVQSVPARPGWIRELYVKSEARGKGVGKLLVKTVEDYFKSKGCDCVLVGVFAPNTEARSFYSSQDYTDREITMLKPLHMEDSPL